MIHILLLILKIIGIIILSIILLLVTLFLLVLFIPIRYRLLANYEEKAEAFIKVSWLFHIITFVFSYTDKSNAIIRIFGIPIYNANRKKEQKKKKKDDTRNRKKTISINKQNDGRIEEDKAENRSNPSRQEERKQDNIFLKEKRVEKEIKRHHKYKMIEIFFHKIKHFLFKIRRACKNIKYTLKRFYDTIKIACNNVNYYNDLLHSIEAKKAYVLCKKQIKYVWKNIKPKKYKIYLHIGNEDPAITGQIMAFYGILYPICTNHVIVVPEFEQNILEGSLFANGKITIFGILCVLWIVYFDKNLRLFLSMLKKEE